MFAQRSYEPLYLSWVNRKSSNFDSHPQATTLPESTHQKKKTAFWTHIFLMSMALSMKIDILHPFPAENRRIRFLHTHKLFEIHSPYLILSLSWYCPHAKHCQCYIHLIGYKIHLSISSNWFPVLTTTYKISPDKP